MSRHLIPFRHFVGKRMVKRGGLVHGCSTKGGRGVNVVSTVLRCPRLLVLSRPFGFLSPDSRSVVGRLLGECGRRRRTAIVVSDRGLGRAMSIYPQVTLLRCKVVVQSVVGRSGSTRGRLRTCFGMRRWVSSAGGRERPVGVGFGLFFVLMKLAIVFDSYHASTPHLSCRTLTQTSILLNVSVGLRSSRGLCLRTTS